MVDGTPCYQGRVSRDICINGICRVCEIGKGSSSPAGRHRADPQGLPGFLQAAPPAV